tara:strand:+ start:1504 stop:1704 length:201 start_codon:yes stop_codon:yes gene_type:complete
MRFIMIKGYNNEDVAVNTANIASVKKLGEDICFLMSGDTPIVTQFTSIRAAVDYVQRAPTVSLGVK